MSSVYIFIQATFMVNSPWSLLPAAAVSGKHRNPKSNAWCLYASFFSVTLQVEDILANKPRNPNIIRCACIFHDMCIMILNVCKILNMYRQIFFHIPLYAVRSHNHILYTHEVVGLVSLFALGEHLQETPRFDGKNDVFWCQMSLLQIHWHWTLFEIVVWHC